MANSVLLYNGDNSNRQFVVNFSDGYNDISEIVVTFDDNPAPEAFVTLNENLIETVNTPGVGVENVKIRRITQVTPIRHLFQDGPGFTQARVNANFSQLLRLIQETNDAVDVPTLQAILDGNVGGVAPRCDVFTSDGTFTPEQGRTLFWVRMVGGGAGSSGCLAAAAGQHTIGPASGGAGYAERMITAAEMGASQPVQVGQGGSAGNINGIGAQGTNSILGVTFPNTDSLLIASTGLPATPLASSSDFRAVQGGIGGFSGGDANLTFPVVSIEGRRGGLTLGDGGKLYQLGSGGGSHWSADTDPLAFNFSAANGRFPGGSAAGACSCADYAPSGLAKTGGTGANGLVEVWSF